MRESGSPGFSVRTSWSRSGKISRASSPRLESEDAAAVRRSIGVAGSRSRRSRSGMAARAMGFSQPYP